MNEIKLGHYQTVQLFRITDGKSIEHFLWLFMGVDFLLAMTK